MVTRTPDEILAAFESAAQQFSRFRRSQQRNGALESATVEAQTRFDQALYLLRRFRELELEHRAKDEALGGASPEQHAVLASEVYGLGTAIRLHGEAFYYFAFRASKALAAIVGFDLAFEPVGVRNVRNHMIEHPDHKHGLMVSWWMFDCPEGLVLAPDNPVGQKKGWVDPGLYPNAQEFIDMFTAKLSKAV